GATYGALGVLGSERRIDEFITTGISDAERARIGHIPEGHGILGLLIDEARPLRLKDLASHPQSSGFPGHHPPMTSFLGAPVRARGRVFGNIYLTDKKDADEFTQQDEDALLVLAAQAGIAVANARIYEESIHRQRSLEVVHDLTERILAGEALAGILGSVAASARELVGADVAMIVGQALPGAPSTVMVAEGHGAEELRGTVVPFGQSISGEVMRTGHPIVVEDATSHPDAYPPIVASAEMGPTIFVPLRLRDRIFGTLSVANRRGGSLFSGEDLKLVQTFANQASVAIEQARSREAHERLALLDDRERIGRELHDGVIQSLFAVGMGLQGTALVASDPEMVRRMERAVEEIDSTIRDLRNYIFGLRPSILDDQELAQALTELADDFSAKSGVVTVSDIDPAAAGELSPLAADIVQLAREALSNVGRHAEASTCRLTLRLDGPTAVLEIDDDGRGFDTALTQSGRGLGNLRARAEQIGSTGAISSTPGEGTTVTIRVPVQSTAMASGSKRG
ncbi:MAG TPA: GAF domain-containing sensor histidine kinase, partial [Candidatus Dormibacteraeota bacterium]|nr:GAF domain-containing sensor histidine kinase [Candidatus Dormibacteraeota bacterium]